MLLVLERLESRLAPASVLTFTDVDGDRVTVTSTRGNLAGRATLAPVGVGEQLQVLDLTDPAFQGAAVATVVTRAPGGDGLVNIGRIDATGRDLAAVTVKGDLGKITAGDGNPAAPALNLLSVRSLGLYGLATQGGSGDLRSAFDGALRALKVAGDVREVTIDVTDSGGATGKLGPVAIGGSLLGGAGDETGRLFARDGMGRVTIGGSVVGGPGPSSGSVQSGAALGRVRIGGDLAGGAGDESGRVFGWDRLAAVVVGGSVLGGTGRESGSVSSWFNLGPVRIGRDLVGQGEFSGVIAADGALAAVAIGGSVVGGPGAVSGLIQAGAAIGRVTIGGDLVGGAGQESGQIFTWTRLAALTVGGSVLGGTGSGSGVVSSDGTLGPVHIGRDLRGGSISGTQPTLDRSGYIHAQGRIAGVYVGGSIVSGTDTSTAGELGRNASIRAAEDLGPVVVKGSLVGNTNPLGSSPVVISAWGQAVVPWWSNIDLAIRSLTVFGRVERALILAGYFPDDITAVGKDVASVGAVTVGGDWVASSLVASVGDADRNGFGTAGDAHINYPGNALLARIVSVRIGGVVVGTAADPNDHFGFVAERIGSFRAGAYVAPLTAGTDVIELSPTTGDVTIREV